MNISNPGAVVGTNSWGSKAYERLVRGSYVDEKTLKKSIKAAKDKGMLIFDFAQDYGLGRAQKMMGRFGCSGIIISSKFTPFTKYKKDQVRKSLERDLKEFHVKSIDIYWLHLPKDIEENMREIIQLYHEGKIRNIGISNFNMDECRQVKQILDQEDIPLYGVQNHYSLINREWEKNGLVDWCKENNILFWAWAVLEEGMLTDPRVKTPKSIMKWMFAKKKKKLYPLYALMNRVGMRHNLTIPQVAMAFCATKGIVPVCGCRKPYQVDQLFEAVSVKLSDKEMQLLQKEADRLNVRIMGADMFRFMTNKKR